MTLNVDELLTYLFDGQQTAFYREFSSWVRASRRFKAFAVEYRSKIHTKLRNVRDESGLQDLRAELVTAFVLLGEKRFDLDYEKYAATKLRGPDFTVTFKTHTPFNVEVRRMRSREVEDDDADARLIKLMAVLCDKIGQMPAGIINVLWFRSERALSAADIAHAMLTLQQRAERKEEAFSKRCGFESAADFLRRSRHLSGIVLWETGKPTVWVHPAAKHKMSPELVHAIQHLEE